MPDPIHKPKAFSPLYAVKKLIRAEWRLTLIRSHNAKVRFEMSNAIA